MKGWIILIVVFVIVGIVIASIIPEPNSVLLECCYNNVKKEMYRQINKITGDPYEWCRQKYPLY